MAANFASQQNLAERLGTVLRRYEHEGGSINELAEQVGEEPRDLRRWAEGAKLPGHVLVALLGELPRHLADYLIKPSGLRLVARHTAAEGNALRAASVASAFASDVTDRMADGEWCHRDKAAAREHAQRTITKLQTLAGE